MEGLDERLVEDERLIPIYEKVALGKRITEEDALTMFSSKDILTLGKIASAVNERINGKLVYFVVNRHINPTNICVGTCKFCAFRREKGDPDAYELTVEEIVEKVKQHVGMGITEIHIVGGLHPEWSYDRYVDIIRQVKDRFPNIHIQAYTAEEIDYLTKLSGKSVRNVLLELIDAGLGSLPAGGAEVFSKRVRKLLCPEKLSAQRYIQIHQTAHRLGLKSNASILYGHIESDEERVEHLSLLRKAQDETGGFQAFLAFAYHPVNTNLGGTFTTGFDDLKMLAVARAFLDNFYHVRAFWIMLGEKLAQVALSFGVSDLDGTVIEEEIAHKAGAKTASFMPKSRLINLIRESGKVPVERDTVYNVLSCPLLKENISGGSFGGSAEPDSG